MSTTRPLRDGQNTGLLRNRADRCPGVLRPWIADDGALLRIRLIGGLMSRSQLAGLAGLSASFGDGNLHLTSRANVQLRAFPDPVPGAAVAGLETLGLLPHATHERVRNVLVSPLTGIDGGVADVRPLAAEYDELLCADPSLADLSARFLVAFDDRGDITRDVDLRALAVAVDRAVIFAGGGVVDEVALADAPTRLIELARWFVSVRGEGDTAAWHIADLPADRRLSSEDRRLSSAEGAYRNHAEGFGTPASPATQPTTGYITLAFDEGILTPFDLEGVLAIAGERIIVTTERSLVLPEAIGC